MVCTNDKKLAREVRIVRAHGWDRNLDRRTQKRIRKEFDSDSRFQQCKGEVSPNWVREELVVALQLGFRYSSSNFFPSWWRS